MSDPPPLQNKLAMLFGYDKGTVPLSHLEGDGDLDAAEVLLVGLVIARGIEVAKVEGVAN